MATLEKEIERKLRKMIERHGGLCLKWVCPGWLGVPDRICLLPGGHVVFVELKRPDGKGKLGAMQKWWARMLSKLGFPHLWISCEEDIHAMELMVREVVADGSEKR
jgi:hypothetical protein